jgi:hypothetical protein
MVTYEVTAEILNAAIEGLESRKRRIDTEIEAIRHILNGGNTSPAATPEHHKANRRKMSTAGRKAIAEAQRKRWANSKSAQSQAPPVTAKPKRKLSAAGRRAISEATKKRWALKRAAAARPSPAVVKKTAAKRTSSKRAVVRTATRAAGAATDAKEA